MYNYPEILKEKKLFLLHAEAGVKVLIKNIRDQ